MNDKILVAYASRTGTTAGVAEAVGKTLAEGGALDISKVPSFGDRLKFRLSVAFGAWTEGDHRNWNAIRAWAADLRRFAAGPR